jgi:hypothetical protein
LNCTTLGGGGGGGTVAAQMALLDDVATDNITYTVNVTETKEINKNSLFETMDVNPSIAANSATLTNFYLANQNATSGLYKSIISQLSSGNFAQAGNLLAGFNPNTSIEQNYKTYFELSKKVAANTLLNYTDKLNLWILAFQCPFTDGAVVYEARVLLNQLHQTAYQFNDANCSSKGFSSGRTGNTNTDAELEEELIRHEGRMAKIYTQHPQYLLYPNPAQDEVSIYSLNTSGKLEITVLDVNGKIVLTKSMLIESGETQLKLNLLNGIYFVNLVDETGTKTVKKLVIAK